MANKILWDGKPGDEIIMIAASGPLRNLADTTIAVSTEVLNGTTLDTWAWFQLYVHDWDAAPDAGAHFEIHIVYQFDGTLYADGEQGDVDNPILSAATQVGVFPVSAGDVPQIIPVVDVPIGPFDFKVCLVNRTGTDIVDGDGSTLTMWRSCLEVQ